MSKCPKVGEGDRSSKIISLMSALDGVLLSFLPILFFYYEAGSHCIALAVLKFRDTPASASLVLGL